MIQICLNCLLLSALLLLISIGLNIIYGISRVVNLAHGSLYALGAYFGYSMVSYGVNFYAALLLAPLLAGLCGVVLERLIIEPIRHRDMTYTLILTYGLSVFIDGMFKFIWSDKVQFIQMPSSLRGTLNLFGVHYPNYRLFVLAATVCVILGLLALLEKTKLGMIMRAASTIPEMVSALGVNMKLVHMGVFGLGCVLAGIGGVIAGPLLSVYPMMGSEMLLSCFVVLVIGGLGSLRGAILASLLVGTAQTLGFVFLTDFAMVIVYLMMAVILLFMPKGLLAEGKFD
ncbi:MAG: branched-chain amino acid ABC transporter permease [Desulfobacteraceae bacterium]|nr:branched-chain amino acid ABC transporter permease [Desulfobacteraceae bacterium]